VIGREYAAMRSHRIERWFNSYTPWTYAAGPFLRLVCPNNFRTSSEAGVIESSGGGVAYFHLRKPVGTKT
jgi:hypothetical protein